LVITAFIGSVYVSGVYAERHDRGGSAFSDDQSA
jgi:hypothetical protein